jgi:hypothetical protein
METQQKNVRRRRGERLAGGREKEGRGEIDDAASQEE